FLVMELLAGEDLARLIYRLGPLPVDLALRVVGQACLGLARAHKAGVIHRDVKPGNLFLAKSDGDERVVKLLDFGVAKIRAEEQASAGVTTTGTLLGSPRYMSPEQARCDKAIDHRAD